MEASVMVHTWSSLYQGPTLFRSYLRESLLRFYASEMLFDSGYCNFSEFERALRRVSAVLETSALPVREHIRSIFRGGNHEIYRDWKLSSLALHLLKINGSPENEQVAAYQLQFLSLSNKNLST